MARYEFSWIDDDGAIGKRFSRHLSMEAWLAVDDLDAPNDPPLVTVITMGRTATRDEALRLALQAVNKTLRHLDSQIEVVAEGDESGVGEPITLGKPPA